MAAGTRDGVHDVCVVLAGLIGFGGAYARLLAAREANRRFSFERPASASSSPGGGAGAGDEGDWRRLS
jgi:hypothetical protein